MCKSTHKLVLSSSAQLNVSGFTGLVPVPRPYCAIPVISHTAYDLAIESITIIDAELLMQNYGLVI